MSSEKGHFFSDAHVQGDQQDRELRAFLTDTPLTLDVMTQSTLEELLAYYIRSVRAGTAGDDLLRSQQGSSRFEQICMTALMRILTTRIDQNNENTASRKEIRNTLIPLLKRSLRVLKKKNREFYDKKNDDTLHHS